ncbi:hypothetical protein [Frigoriglobus tundricola]|uniref:hypothetical protein n=1 Tax=Frigoriglobus tundricola TaxID=2774151 RepID=UPI00148E9CC6|nr:hypothetical protein [Frigoriglobus tundricola]
MKQFVPRPAGRGAPFEVVRDAVLVEVFGRPAPVLEVEAGTPTTRQFHPCAVRVSNRSRVASAAPLEYSK